MPIREAVRDIVRRGRARVANGLRRRASAVVDRVVGRSADAAPDPVPSPPVPVAVASPEPEPAPVAPEPVAAEVPGLDRDAVERLFEDMVRPALQSDGGDITLVDVKGNDVYVELVGACHSCASAVVTMENGIERLLAEEFPQFGRLIRVDA